MNLVLLTATLAALLSGPLLYAAARDRAPLLAFIDGFVLVAITGLVLVEVLPEAFGSGGWWSIGFMLLGALGPTLFEHQLHHAREVHVAALMLAIAGLVLHSFADGVALAPQLQTAAEAQPALALAIVVHSVPVGLAVWWLLYPVFGAPLPALALMAMCLGTVAGYRYGGPLGGVLGATAWAWFQALVAGSILHVVLGRPHLDEHSAHRTANPPFEGLGNLAALGGLALLELLHLPGAHPHGFWERLLQLSLESAPALLAAYLIGGFIGTQLPDRWLRWLARGGPASQAARGVALGLPLPICSCGVLPLYRSLVLRGAPVAAALAFLVATPEVGLTALFVSLPLLGLEMTLLRVGGAALLAFAVAYVVARLFPQPARPRFVFDAGTLPAEHDCCRGQGSPRPHTHTHTHDHAHVHRPAQGQGHGHAQEHLAAPAGRPADAAPSRLRAALRLGLLELVDGTAGWILFGLALAAFAAPHIAQTPWERLPDALEVLAFALLGLPLYVCAAGATPLVAVFVAGGVSPGAALAFLLTGPATNVASFGVLRELHGAGLAAVFALTAAASAIALGLAVNAWIPAPSALVASHQAQGSSLLQQLSLAVLVMLFAASLLRRGGRSFFGELFEPRPSADV